MPGEGNALQFQINKLVEQLKTETDPVKIAQMQESIKELKQQQQERN